ncbi:UDP-glucose 4-epimerase [Leptodontidium sp. 2 PMI_412]|nr:UDP-glucose 4-epimerase [Leptodontidium sp. 2 PMI_412]
MYSPATSSPGSSPRNSVPSTPGTELGTLFDDVSLHALDDEYILVTGGLGFIGSHTSLELLKAGYNIIIVDDFSNSFDNVFSKILTLASRHFDNHGGHCPKAELHNANYRDESAMRALFDSHCNSSVLGKGGRSNITGVIHFAAFKAVEGSIREPLKYYQNNVNGLVDLLALLDEYGIKSFIFSSSAVVYGTLAESNGNLREEHVVHQEESYEESDGTFRHSQPGSTGITNPYGRTKFFGEAILSDLAISDPSWSIAGLRYFNPIGCDPSGLLGEDPKGIPSNLLPVVVKVLTGQYDGLSVFGGDWETPDGTAIRDFIHVTDLARGHIAALAAIRARRICGEYRTFNLGTGAGYSVLDVVAAMEAASQREVPRTIVAKRDGDVKSSVASADRARHELGWQAERSLAQACRDVWNFLEVSGGTGSGCGEHR